MLFSLIFKRHASKSGSGKRMVLFAYNVQLSTPEAWGMQECTVVCLTWMRALQGMGVASHPGGARSSLLF